MGNPTPPPNFNDGTDFREAHWKLLLDTNQMLGKLSAQVETFQTGLHEMRGEKADCQREVFKRLSELEVGRAANGARRQAENNAKARLRQNLKTLGTIFVKYILPPILVVAGFKTVEGITPTNHAPPGVTEGSPPP